MGDPAAFTVTVASADEPAAAVGKWVVIFWNAKGLGVLILSQEIKLMGRLDQVHLIRFWGMFNKVCQCLHS